MKSIAIIKIFAGLLTLTLITVSCKKENNSPNNSNNENMEATIEKNAVQDFATDPNINVGTKAFLKVLNSGGTPLEKLSKEDARNVLVNAQAAVKVDVSGVEEAEKTIEAWSHHKTKYCTSGRQKRTVTGFHFYTRRRLDIGRLPYPQKARKRLSGAFRICSCFCKLYTLT